MKKLKKMTVIVLFAVLAGCVTIPANHLTKQPGVNMFMVSRIPLLLGNLYISYSQLSGNNSNEIIKPVLIQETTKNDWVWKILVDQSLLNDARIIKLSSELVSGFKEFSPIAEMLLGEETPVGNFEIIIVPPNNGLRVKKYRYGIKSVPLRYYIHMPSQVFDEKELSKWAVRQIATLAHEYFHVAEEYTGPPFPNRVSEEAAANLFTICTIVGLNKDIAAKMEFLDENGEPMRPGSVKPVEKKEWSEIDASVQGKAWAAEAILHVLETSSIKIAGSENKNLLFGLCKTLIKERVDVTEPYDFSGLRSFKLH